MNCECGKVRFEVRAHAQEQLNRMPRDDPRRREVRVYRCRFGGWHLTSHESNDHNSRPVGEIVLQSGRRVTCPWCGRRNVLVARGRVLSGHRDLKLRDLPICTGSGRKVKYNEHGTVVKA